MTAADSTQTITLGGRTFQAAPLPWGRLRKVMAAINRVGTAAAAGLFDESSLDDMAAVLCAGYNIAPEDLEAMPTTIEEVQRAFDAVVKISGLEQAMEKALGEARRAGRLPVPPAAQTLTPGMPSTPTS